MAKLHSISSHQPPCIKAIDPEQIYQIPVLRGVEEYLVGCRELRNKYETNRDIKYLATFFLLKALTTSGKIENWRAQRQLILPFLQLNEPTFYTHIKALKEKGLVTVDRSFNITLISNRDLAKVLDIAYAGIHYIPFNPYKYEGKQVFQYLLRCEEIRDKQEHQLTGLLYHLDQNPPLRNDLLLLMVRHGADQDKLLKDRLYLQERLLHLQQQLFKHGSDILEYVFTRRADINRSIMKIKADHHYKSYRSVGYLKRRLQELGLIELKRVCVESKVRSRLYVPDARRRSGRRDGYQWNGDTQKTAWHLTDQITIKYESKNDLYGARAAKKAA